MREVNESQTQLRRFLLDELDEAERRRIEELFISDGDYRENVLIAEEELIEDYLEGSLPVEERERFLSHYLTTPEQRRKLRVAKSIKKFAAVGVPATATPTDGGGPQHGAGRPGRANRLTLRNPLVSLPLAAALIFAIGIGVIKLLGVWRPNKQQEQEQAQRTTDERELAQSNDPSLPVQQRVGGTAFSVNVLPVSPRGGSAAKFSPPPQAAPVQLLLVLGGDEYQSYQVDLLIPGRPGRRIVRQLHAEATPAGRAIPLIIPASLLTRGDYRVRLAGLTPAGDVEEIAEYTFQVAGG